MKKKRIGILVSVVVMAVAAIGFTLAILNSITETKVNAFSSNKNISIQLREPAWDGYTFEDPEDPNGSSAKPDVITDPNNPEHPLGVNEAKRYVPGQIIYKDPTVKNNGGENSVAAYVAIKVQYFDYKGKDGAEQQIRYSDFKQQFLVDEGIKFDNNWLQIGNENADEQIYLYGTRIGGAIALNTGAQTTPLFTEVPISFNLEPDATTGKLPGFNIKVKAYAIQVPGIDASEAKEALLTFIGQN